MAIILRMANIDSNACPARMPCAMQLRRLALQCRGRNGSSGSCKRCGSCTAAHIQQWISSPAAAPWEKWVYPSQGSKRCLVTGQWFVVLHHVKISQRWILCWCCSAGLVKRRFILALPASSIRSLQPSGLDLGLLEIGIGTCRFA